MAQLFRVRAAWFELSTPLHNFEPWPWNGAAALFGSLHTNLPATHNRAIEQKGSKYAECRADLGKSQSMKLKVMRDKWLGSFSGKQMNPKQFIIRFFASIRVFRVLKSGCLGGEEGLPSFHFMRLTLYFRVRWLTYII